jgi:hypothetical protein
MCEEEIKKLTDPVLKYILPDTCSDAEKDANPITAEEIVDAIKAGKDVEIINAVITGPFILKSINVEGEVTIQRTKIRDPIDWSYAAFKRVLNLENSIFETDVTFTTVTVEKDIFLDNATFWGEAKFSDITVMGVFYSRSTTFRKDVIFTDGRFKKRIDFSKSTFEGEADFVSARIGSTAGFTGAEFKQLASFNGAKIEGAAFFKRATFEGEADFVSARIGCTAEFTGAEFKQLASFNRAQIGESAFFNPATFEGEANFGSARIGSTAEFTGAEFKERASFNGAQIEEAAFFNLATFEGEANFGSARIGNTAEFTGAEFKQLASFNRAQIEEAAFFNPATFEGEADFVSARIGGIAEFTGAEFKQQVYFDSAQIKRESHFEETIFANDVSFQDTSLKTVFFGEPNVQFIKNIDLRGCIYDRIQPISFWEQLMEHLGPYDRQPFTQLEETFRRAGKDKLADDVYYMRKRRESAQKTIRKPGAWLLDRFLWLLTGYGVRLYRLLLPIVLILLIGTIIFHLEGAVKLDIQLPCMMSSQVTLPCWEAFWVSLNTFLPIGIPSGADWKPSSQIIPMLGIKFTTFATLLDLAGWILVPVGVAGIAGLLKRSK